MGRRIAGVVVIVLLGLNTWSGVGRIRTFVSQLRASRALQEGRLSDSMAALREALRWGPDDTNAHNMLAQVVRNALANGLPIEPGGHDPDGILGVGLAVAGYGIALNPADALGWFNLGTLYQGYRTSRIRLERMRAADDPAAPEAPESGDAVPGLEPEDRYTVAAVFEAIEREPENFFYHDYLARLYWERGLPLEAAREIQTSMSLTPRLDAHAVLQRADLLDDLAAAVLSGIEASEANRFVGPVMAARARAETLAKLERLEEAVQAYETLRRVGGDELASESLFRLGSIQQRLGRYADSIPMLEEANSLGGKDVWAALSLHFLALAHSKLGHLDQALEYHERFLERAPDSPLAYNAYAEDLEAVGRSQEAGQMYIAAVRRFPSDPWTYRRVIEHLRRHGEPARAIPYAEALRKVDPEDGSVEALIEALRREVRASRPAGK